VWNRVQSFDQTRGSLGPWVLTVARNRAIDYLQKHTEVRDVLLSGGDALLLSDNRLRNLLGRLRAIEHIEFLRIGSRVPIFLPQRITPELCAMLKEFHPLWMSVHVNHPKELTAEVRDALGRLADAGIPLGNQSVLLKGVNDDEAVKLVDWAHGEGHDITFIEVMPLGEVGSERFDQFLPLNELRATLERRFTLTPSPYSSAGPARYFDVAETGGRLGFITPLTHNFCEGCNRVRVTSTGRLYMCLGQEDAVDLREPIRRSGDDEMLTQAIRAAIRRKPMGHDFLIGRTGSHACDPGRSRISHSDSLSRSDAVLARTDEQYAADQRHRAHGYARFAGGDHERSWRNRNSS